MRDKLLAYLLNDLDEEQRARVESRLKSDSAWQHELQRLRSYVEAAPKINSEQGDADDMLPNDLVRRTCSFVEQASSQGELSPAVLPALLSESQDAAAAQPKRWSLIDFSVAACILLVMGSLLLPALRESRDAARRAQCKSNLYQLGTALHSFADRSSGQLPAIEKHENAGMYTLKLAESGVLTHDQLAKLLVCPSTQLADDVFRGVKIICIPTRKNLAAATGEKRKLLLENMGGQFWLPHWLLRPTRQLPANRVRR